MSMNPQCFNEQFTFYSCCLKQRAFCFDQQFSFEYCCPGAARVAPYFGDPQCFSESFYSFDRCCAFNDSECFRPPFTFERCCGATPSESLAKRLTECQGHATAVANPVLAKWSNGSNQSVMLHFGQLMRVTSVMLYSSQVSSSSFTGRFQLMANQGLGPRPLRQLKLRSRGEFQPMELHLEDAMDVYSLTLRLHGWRGDPAELYFTARGCPAANKTVVLLHCHPRRNSKGELNSAAAPDLSNVQLMEVLFDWLVIKRRAANPGACFRQLDVALRELRVQQRLGEVTVLLSPYLGSWHLQSHALELWRLTGLVSHDFAVLGMPSGGVRHAFSWPLRRLRRQYWKLQVMDYPTGSARYSDGKQASDLCHGGDAVSASRVYKSSVLESLLDGVKAEAGAEWLLNLDLEALVQGVNHRSFLCAVGFFDEEDYLQHVNRLTSHLSLRYSIEVARLGPGDPLVNCAVTLESQQRQRPVSFSNAGLVMPWCFRRALRRAWQHLTAWWSSLSHHHHVVPSDGTGLSLLRNLEEPIPWDHDIDIWLIARGPIRWLRQFEKRITAHPALRSLRLAGFTWFPGVNNYTKTGGGVHVMMNFSDVTDLGTVLVDLDLIFKPYFPRSLFPFATKFFGSPAATGKDHILGVAEKFRSAKKLHRSKQPFNCSRPGHPACIPATKVACEGCSIAACEFEDRFILLDWFE